LAGKLNLLLNVPTVGASGAVFGILLGFGMLFPNTELMLLFPPIPIKAKYFVLGYGAIELFSGIANTGDNIAHFAHLGGMLFGFILIKYWNKTTTHFY
jgi:membrane associated rhomboid family serine protease